MSSSVRQAVSSIEVHSMDGAGQPTGKSLPSHLQPTPAKAHLRTADVVKDALVEHYGKLEVAAREMHMDASQLSRDVQTGNLHLKKLDALDEAGKAIVVDRLQQRLGQPSDPKDLIRREIREARTRLDRIEELIARG